MFPYRQRRPTYGGKFAKEIKSKLGSGNTSRTDIAEAQLANGGPVERAIKADLLELYQIFKSAITKEKKKKEKTLQQQHDKIGISFAIFRQLFRKYKLGAIHTRALPPRCDHDAFIQIIYSACFSLLADAFKGTITTTIMAPVTSPTGGNGKSNREEPTINTTYASFAIFALYTMFETNTLPTFPLPSSSSGNDSKDILSLLPLNIASKENPKNLYRRNYKSPIRIDKQHFCWLIQLRDLCMNCLSDCERHRMQKMIQKYEESIDDDDCENGKCSSLWKCNCGIAADAIQIIDKMIQNEEYFDLCEYTGPGTLEGLTGSAGWNHSNTPQATAAATHESTKVPMNMHELKIITNHTNNVLKEQLDLSPLESCMKEYTSSIDSIRLNRTANITTTKTTNRNDTTAMKPVQAALVQKALEPVLKRRKRQRNASGNAESNGLVNVLQQLCDKSYDLENHSFIDDDGNDSDEAEGTLNSQNAMRSTPISTTARALFRRGDVEWNAPTDTSVSKSTKQKRIDNENLNNYGNAPKEQEMKNDNNNGVEPLQLVFPTDMSQSLQSGIQDALGVFIKDIQKQHQHLTRNISGGDSGSRAGDGKDSHCNISMNLEEGIDDSIGVNKEDEISSSMHAAASTISQITGQGHAALQTLLSSAVSTDEARTKSVDSKGASMHREFSKMEDLQIGDTHRSAVSIADAFLNLPGPDRSDDEIDRSDESSKGSISSNLSPDGLSMAVSMTSSSVGRNALNVLLSQVDGDKGGRRRGEEEKKMGGRRVKRKRKDEGVRTTCTPSKKCKESSMRQRRAKGTKDSTIRRPRKPKPKSSSAKQPANVAQPEAAKNERELDNSTSGSRKRSEELSKEAKRASLIADMASIRSHDTGQGRAALQRLLSSATLSNKSESQLAGLNGIDDEGNLNKDNESSLTMYDAASTISQNTGQEHAALQALLSSTVPSENSHLESNNTTDVIGKKTVSSQDHQDSTHKSDTSATGASLNLPSPDGSEDCDESNASDESRRASLLSISSVGISKDDSVTSSNVGRNALNLLLSSVSGGNKSGRKKLQEFEHGEKRK